MQRFATVALVSSLVLVAGIASAQPVDDLTRGKELFAANTCSACHGANAEGVAVFPNLQGKTAEQVLAQVRNPTGIMPQFDTSRLSDADLDLIAGWVESLSADEPAEEEAPAEEDEGLPLPTGDYSDTPAAEDDTPAAEGDTPAAEGEADDAADAEAIAAGRKLYIARSCMMCHGMNGEGRPETADLRGKDRDAIFKQLRTPRDRMPPYPVEQLSDADAELLAAYLGSLEVPDPPGDDEADGGLTGGLD